MRTVLAALALVSVASCADAESEDTRPVTSASESRPSTPSSSSSTPQPGQTSETSRPAGYAESEQCRRDARRVLDLVDLALKRAEVRDAADRLQTIEGLMPQAVSECTGAVAAPTVGAVDNLRAAVDAATTDQLAERYAEEAARQHRRAQEAVDAFA